MNRQQKYTVILEKGASSYGAYVPDLPGCVAVGETKEEAIALIQEAIELHLEDLIETDHRTTENHQNSEINGWLVAAIIVMIVFTFSGIGFMVARPLLNSDQ